MFATLGGFFAKPLVKYVGLPLLAAIILGVIVSVAVSKWNSYKADLVHQGFVAGEKSMEEKIRKQVEQNNLTNRTVENAIGDAVDGFGAKVDQFFIKLNRSQRNLAKDIGEQIADQPAVFNNPECVTPQSTIDARNGIRSLGPPAASPTVGTEE